MGGEPVEDPMEAASHQSPVYGKHQKGKRPGIAKPGVLVKWRVFFASAAGQRILVGAGTTAFFLLVLTIALVAHSTGHTALAAKHMRGALVHGRKNAATFFAGVSKRKRVEVPASDENEDPIAVQKKNVKLMSEFSEKRDFEEKLDSWAEEVEGEITPTQEKNLQIMRELAESNEFREALSGWLSMRGDVSTPEQEKNLRLMAELSDSWAFKDKMSTWTQEGAQDAVTPEREKNLKLMQDLSESQDFREKMSSWVEARKSNTMTPEQQKNIRLWLSYMSRKAAAAQAGSASLSVDDSASASDMASSDVASSELPSDVSELEAAAAAAADPAPAGKTAAVVTWLPLERNCPTCAPQESSPGACLVLTLYNSFRRRGLTHIMDFVVLVPDDAPASHVSPLQREANIIVKRPTMFGPHTELSSMDPLLKLFGLMLVEYATVAVIAPGAVITGDMSTAPLAHAVAAAQGVGMVSTQGPLAPLSGDFFIVHPKSDSFLEIEDLWRRRTDAFNPANGWENFGPLPTWPGAAHPGGGERPDSLHWSFPNAGGTDGMLYYYYALRDKSFKAVAADSVPVRSFGVTSAGDPAALAPWQPCSARQGKGSMSGCEEKRAECWEMWWGEYDLAAGRDTFEGTICNGQLADTRATMSGGVPTKCEARN
eukprot:jgi/Mesvir1/1062/Mv17581-RA.1